MARLTNSPAQCLDIDMFFKCCFVVLFVFFKGNNGSQLYNKQCIFDWSFLIFEPSSQEAFDTILCLLGFLVDMDWSMMKRIEDQATDLGWQDLVHMWLLISSHAFCWIHGTQIKFNGLRRGLHAIDSELEQEAWARWKRTYMISVIERIGFMIQSHTTMYACFLKQLLPDWTFDKNLHDINRDDIGWQSWCFFLLTFRLGTQRLRRIRDFLCGNQARDSFTPKVHGFFGWKITVESTFQNKERSLNYEVCGFPMINPQKLTHHWFK